MSHWQITQRLYGVAQHTHAPGLPVRDHLQTGTVSEVFTLHPSSHRKADLAISVVKVSLFL